MNLKKLTGKLVYLFGGSAGIGLALAHEFLSAGARVVVFSRSTLNLEKALGALRQTLNQNRLHTPGNNDDKTKLPVSAVELDVTSATKVASVLKRTLAEQGTPDIVVNNVGRARPGYFEEIGIEQFDQTIDVNLRSMWHTLKVLLPAMKNRGGYVVNVSSMVGFAGVFGYTDYAASKFGVIGLTEALRSEYRSYGIRFSVLCPPDTLTPGFHDENRTKPPETVAASAGVRPVGASVVARACLRGMRRGRFIITATFMARLVWFLKRHFPGLLFSIMDGDIKKARAKRGA